MAQRWKREAMGSRRNYGMGHARTLVPQERAGKRRGKRDLSAVCNCLVRGYEEGDKLFFEVHDDKTKEFSVGTSKKIVYQEHDQTLAAQRNTQISTYGGTQNLTGQSNK